MKAVLIAVLSGVLFGLFLQPAAAGTFICYAVANPYCNYKGKLSRINVNEADSILVFYDGTVDDSLIDATTLPCGFSVNANKSTIYKPSWDDGSGFSNSLYATILLAYALNKDITLRLACVHGDTGVLQIERLWLEG